MSIKVQHIRVGICQGYEKRTANKGRFVVSDAELRRQKKLEDLQRMMGNTDGTDQDNREPLCK